jgi:thiol:disulfide interchange protein DsbA
VGFGNFGGYAVSFGFGTSRRIAMHVRYTPALFLARWIALLVLAGATGLASAQIQFNKEYSRLDTPRPVATPGKIEVIEFFYYGCPVCYELEPTLSRWAIMAPDYVQLRRVPALSSENWETFAKLFYALEAVGEIARLHWPVYDNFHFDGVKLNDEKVMLDWVTRNRVDRQKFLDAYNSAEVKAQVEAARKMMHDYNIHGVPTLVVDGKFVTSAHMAGSTRAVPAVLNQLIEIARKERGN